MNMDREIEIKMAKGWIEKLFDGQEPTSKDVLELARDIYNIGYQKGLDFARSSVGLKPKVSARRKRKSRCPSAEAEPSLMGGKEGSLV